MPSIDTSYLVGRIVDVQPHLFVTELIEDEQGKTPTITIGDKDVLVGQIGSYVAIAQGPLQLIAIVTRMTEKELLATPLLEIVGEEPARLPFAKRLAYLTPIGTIDNGEFTRGVSVFPTTGAEVFAIGPEQVQSMFKKFESFEFYIGTLSANSQVRVPLNPTNLFGRHFAILGQTGSGKSWTVASLVQHAVEIMPRAHIIILDLHGEYCWKDQAGKEHFAFAPAFARHIDARKLEIPYWLMTYAELCDLLIDHTEHSAHNQTAVFRDQIGRLRSTEGARLGLEQTTADTPVYFDLDQLRQAIESINGKVPGKNGNPINGPLTGAFDNFLMRLDSKLNDVRYDFLFCPRVRTSSESLPELLRDFVGLGSQSAAITVIDLSSVPFDVRPTVAAQIGRMAFEFNYWNPRYREFPLLLVCEESHAYVPKTSESQFAGARKSMERIAKEGRKYGVGLGIVSQRPHEVSETVLAQCGTFICLRITNPDDQNYIRRLVPESEGDLTSMLAGLGRGEALVLGEAIALPTRVQFTCPNPTPHSNDVDFYTNWKENLGELDVDAIVHRWRSQERSPLASTAAAASGI